MVKKRRIILYPHLGDIAGTGHIKRLLQFIDDNRFICYFIHEDFNLLLEISKKFCIERKYLKTIDELSKYCVDLLILDNRESDLELYNTLKKIAPVVGIDEGGSTRDYVPYLIDILPNLQKTEANYSNIGLLDLPNKEQKINGDQSILITFGGQDPYNLTQVAVNKLKDKYDITTVIGPLFSIKDFGVKKIEHNNNIKDQLRNYDLVVTTYGLTAFEAISSGIPVVLLNPTKYHNRLGKKVGFYCVGKSFKFSFNRAIEISAKIKIGIKESLSDLVYSIELSPTTCPICGSGGNRVIQRFKDKTYLYCEDCKLDYLLTNSSPKEYLEEYFFKDYKKQYGKTYLEDFEHIKELGYSRISYLKLNRSNNKRLLDIGCAYGPFLQSALDLGFEPYGIDVSESAIDYVKNKLRIKSIKTKFPFKDNIGFPETFNYITMWFVLEHFSNLGDVLSKVYSLLDTNGVFAFPTPNSRGISGIKYKKSVETIWI